jgi:hypothetical protein
MRKLPFPRLELRWREATAEEFTQESANWVCDYMLVLSPPDIGDIRSNNDNDDAGEVNVEYILSSTYINGYHSSGPYDGDTVERPYRDGAHAMWDSEKLNIPAYAVYKGKATRIKPIQKKKS